MCLFVFPDCPGVVDLEPVSKLPLKHLTLSDCPGVVDLEPICKLSELQNLTLSDCPAVVHLESITRLPKLYCLTLAGGVTDTALYIIGGCSELLRLTLGDLQRPAETAITAAAVSRSVDQSGRLL